MPVLPLGAPPAHSDVEPREALCASCIAHGGLCATHLNAMLGVRPPWWVQLIGKPHICERSVCEGHQVCLADRTATAPRASCGCHNCGQQRLMRQELRGQRKVSTSREASAHADRKRAARRPKKRSRLARALAGEFTKVRRVA